MTSVSPVFSAPLGGESSRVKSKDWTGSCLTSSLVVDLFFLIFTPDCRDHGVSICNSEVICYNMGLTFGSPNPVGIVGDRGMTSSRMSASGKGV